jgi:hypothetical protein
MSWEWLLFAVAVVYLLWRIARAVEEPMRRQDQMERERLADEAETARLKEIFKKTGRWEGP